MESTLCEASIHVPHRRARAKERLVVQRLPNMVGMQGLYPAFPTDPTARSIAKDCDKLVCTRGLTKAIIKRVRFQQGTPPILIKTWGGKQNAEVVLTRRYHQDAVRFSDGLEIALPSLKPGTRIDIGIPVKRRKPGGMQMINKALKEVMALPPDPKPEDEPREPQREREPAPADPRDPPVRERERE